MFFLMAILKILASSPWGPQPGHQELNWEVQKVKKKKKQFKLYFRQNNKLIKGWKMCLSSKQNVYVF